MKLYYKPGTCSQSPHIALREAGLSFDLVRVDTKKGVTEDGTDYRTINPKGYVPALKLDDGQVLTEGPAIVQYVADLAPGAKLAPPAGTLERVRLQEWLNYIATEVHKTFSPLFSPTAPEEWKKSCREALGPKFDWLSEKLGAAPYLTGETFTVADGYLFVVLGWSAFVGIDLARWPALVAFRERIAARPAVQAAMKAEGLIK